MEYFNSTEDLHNKEIDVIASVFGIGVDIKYYSDNSDADYLSFS